MSIWYSIPLVVGLLAMPARTLRADEGSNAMPQAEPAAAPQPTAAAPGAMNTCGAVRIHFATDSSEISAADKQLLDNAADCLKANQRLRVSVVGNTDKRGTPQYNQELGQKRADAVSLYLTEKGVQGHQLETMSLGEDRPLCESTDAECLARNRRTAVRPACHL